MHYKICSVKKDYNIANLQKTKFELINYSSSRALTARSDVRKFYEVAKYLEDGAKLMINNNWLEAPPPAPERKELKNV
jgi:hypothetical protein